MRNIILKNVDMCTNQSITFKIVFISNSFRIHKALQFGVAFIFRSHFLFLMKLLSDNCDMENVNANVRGIDIMLFKELKRRLWMRISMPLQFFPFVLNTMTKLKIETLQVLGTFYPYLAVF